MSRQLAPGLLLLVCVTLFTTGLSRADTLKITLDDALELASKRSLSYLKAIEDSIALAGEWRSSSGKWLPQLSASGSAPDWYSTRYNTGSEAESKSWIGRINVSQRLPWGAELSAGEGLSRIVTSTGGAGGRLSSESYRLTQFVEISQPLLAGNPLGRQRKQEKLRREASLLAHEIDVRAIRYAAATAFFNLIQATQGLEIARKDLEQGASSADLAGRKLKAGLIPEVELLQIQVDVARREYSVRQAEGAVESAMDGLRIAIGVDPGVFLLCDAGELDEVAVAIPAPPSLEARPDARRTALGYRAQELETLGALKSARWNLNLDLGYSGSTLAGELEELGLQPQSESLRLDLTFDLPLFGFGATSGYVQSLKARWRAAGIEEKLLIQRMEIEQRESFRRLDRARDRIRISKSALELAERSYAITSDRFANGLISSRDLLDAQLELTQTRREAVNAQIEFQLALAAIEQFLPSR